jgi:uncharacterized glyoxalase superfamily protein PhnB
LYFSVSTVLPAIAPYLQRQQPYFTGSFPGLCYVQRMPFPPAVTEIPAADIENAVAYYVRKLGFAHDWTDESGIAGVSREECRLFITSPAFRERHGNTGPILFWLNLDSKSQVDELFAEWRARQARFVSEPEDKPYKLREFMAADLDGNLIRVFYDFSRDE